MSTNANGDFQHPRPARPHFFAMLHLVTGCTLLWGGAVLWRLNGSPYYFLVGASLLVCGALLFSRMRVAAALYGATLVASTAWALWEVGLDFWALTPRLLAFVILGSWYLTPWVWRRLRGWPVIGAPRAAAWTLAALSFAALVGLVLHALFFAAGLDPMYQAGSESAASAPYQGLRAGPPDGDWRSWGNDQQGTRFSPLSQITAANVGNLKIAWVYRFGPGPSGGPASLEGTPIKIDDTLYTCSDYNDVVALDAETGHERWRFRANDDLEGTTYGHCRGVAYYRVPLTTGACAERVYTNTIDARLIALDAKTGLPCADFGSNGIVSLAEGLTAAPKGYYFVTSAPTIARGRIVVGGWVSDGMFWGEPSGVIRAFDGVTGKLSWAFDLGRPDRRGLPPDGEFYTPGTPNSWAPMSVDEALGLIYAPLGGATLDYVGIQRREFDDAYSDAVVALDADTGVPRWRFQTVRHDLWDYDAPAQPTLVDFPTTEGTRPALIETTKRGEIFVLDRVTGQPLLPVLEHPAPRSGAVPGERVAATQPFSDSLPSFRGLPITEESMWGLTPLDQLWCRIKFREARYEGTLTPPGLSASIASPGFLGGSDWGGVSVDLDRNLMILNTNYVGAYVQLLTRAEADRLGVRPTGFGGAQPKAEGQYVQPHAGTLYAARALPFLSFLYTPCQAPPWGRISAVDLSTHKLVWSHSLGTARDSGPLGLPSLLPFRIGTPNLGGSVVTRGGLTFIGAAQDNYIRAFETATGRLMWSARLSASAQATPMTYFSNQSGRQFVAISAGGHYLLNTKKGDYIYAFALPNTRQH